MPQILCIWQKHLVSNTHNGGIFLKRTFIYFICIILLVCMLAIPASATGIDQQIISQNVIYISDDYYYIETITIPAVQPYGSTKTGTKTSVCVSSGTSIFTLTVTGTFTYDGSSSTATKATGSISTHVASATVNDRYAYTSGSSACAFASVSYNGATLQKTVTLTCDKNGNLS